MEIRRFQPQDAAPVAALIAKTLRISNRADYDRAYLERIVSSYSPQSLVRRAEEGHFYVACAAGAICGCGCISPHGADGGLLTALFVLPDYQGRGVGRQLIEALERDPYFTRARRVALASSITAYSFYRKLGYTCKDGIETPDASGCIRLEKSPSTTRI